MHGGRVMSILPPWVYPAGLGVAALIGLAAGAGITVVIKDGEIADMQRDQAVASQRAANINLSRLQAVQARGDELTNDLLAARAEADAAQEQLNAALSRATTGRTCLGGGALRLLDRAALGVSADLPPAASSPAAADAADVATDTQVAQWAGSAIHQYAECARRLDALIRFSEDAQ